MEIARDVVAWILILGGCFVTIVGSVGLLRLPDVYTRVHSAGVVDTVGAAFLLFGLCLYGGFTLITVKLLMILAFVFFTSPTATNALANAVYTAGVKPVLADEEDESSKP